MNELAAISNKVRPVKLPTDDGMVPIISYITAARYIKLLQVAYQSLQIVQYLD